MKVHFLGIGGSGMSGVASLALKNGYEVTGCDLNVDTPYIKELIDTGVEIFQGQDENHLKNVDLVAATPAVFFQNRNHPEVELARKERKLITWQKFLGQYLQKEKEVICIAGTHGKSTTTALTSLLFENAKLDPSVMIGANIKEWNTNYRYGESKYFIAEADEFYDNFLNYTPDVIILNNIEFDHPDYFNNEEEVFKSFIKFINKLRGKKILIYNQDDEGVLKLLQKIGKIKLNGINLYGYTTKNLTISYFEDRTEFEFENNKYLLKIPGEYNVSNALGVITLAKIYKIKNETVQHTLENFDGIGRRLELIGEKEGIKVYDDYAHHPTAIKKTLEGLRQKYPNKNILAIIEPHTFSRTKALLPFYKDSFNSVNEVIIAPIFRSRDTEDFGISGRNIVDIAKHAKISYVDDFEKIANYVKKNMKSFNVIIVMGAGESYKLAREILNKL